jgi:protein-S-isoprenylcysteine O-methyltransferase Ste14
MSKLNTKAWLGLAFVIIAMGLLLFISAGTVHYWQAWTYLAVYFGASLLISLYLMKKDPALLQRRLRGGPTTEKTRTQQISMLFASAGFIGSLIVPALDYRFAWSNMPIYAVVAGDVLTVVSFYIMFLVLRENTFASATIEIAEDQKVISTGLYAFVRHPMYAGGSLLFIGTPLALGSYWGVLAFSIVLPALIWRLLDEEKFLAKNLQGYAEYCAKVHWRLIPGIF